MFTRVTDTSGREYTVRQALADFLDIEGYQIASKVSRLPKRMPVSISHLKLTSGGFINVIEYNNGTIFLIHTPVVSKSEVYKIERK